MKFEKSRETQSIAQAVFRFVTYRTCRSVWENAQACLVLALFFVLVGCSSDPTTFPFLNNTHRQAYSLTEDDLKKVQFYVSTEVIVLGLDPGAAQSWLDRVSLSCSSLCCSPNWI